jgi:pilus assembly protein CpaC
MYDNHQGDTVSAYRKSRRSHLPAICTCLIATVLASAWSIAVQAQELQSASVIRKISGTNEKLELTTNTSRILTLDKNIPRVQVNNPELLAVTPLSATQVQISAKKAGVTQVNLWDDEGKVHAVDVLIYGDARELEIALQTQFPHASIKVFRYSESLVLTGFVDRPDHVSPIMQLAADYSPKVINNISVGGVQQVLLKVKVMEISRTKLRRMAVDLHIGTSNGSFFSTGVSGLLTNTSNIAGHAFQTVTDTTGNAAEFGIVGNHTAFFGFLDMLQQNNIAKILSEPNIVAVSGRPAQFQVGGEIPIIVPQSLGTSSIEFKPFGTQIDFLPIVLGNGNIRLEVRPRISELDPSIGITTQQFTVPGLTVRQVDTAVEMKAGQTFALAGLVQEKTDSVKRGLPYVQDMPIVGVPFRKTENVVNEVELLVIVTPEFVDPIDACEAPCGGPGMSTTSPNNRGLFCGGYMEVPTACNPTQGLGSCGQDPCGHCNGGCGCNGTPVMKGGIPVQGMPAQNMMPTPTTQMPGGSGYDDSTSGTAVLPTPESDQDAKDPAPAETTSALPAPQELSLPESTAPEKSQQPTAETKPAVETKPAAQPPIPPQPAAPETPSPKPTQTPPVTPVPGPAPNNGSYYPGTLPGGVYQPPANSSAQYPAYTAPRSYSPAHQPVFVRNASRPNNPQPQHSQTAPPARDNSLIGPVGYDVQQ